MALINSQDKLIQDFSKFFGSLEKVFDNSCQIPAHGGHVQVGGPLVALDKALGDNSIEQPKGFVQMFEEFTGLKESEYAKLALQYGPMVIRFGKSLLPYLKNDSLALFPIIQNVGIIGIGIAGFAELVILKEIIEKDCSSSCAAAKALLVDTMEYTKVRILRNSQRFSEIEELIEKAKVEDFDCNTKKKNVLLIKLEEKIRVCKIDISECMQKTKELFKEIKSYIEQLNKTFKRSAWAAAGFGVLAVAGSVAAVVATGGLAIAAGVAAGATGVATGGLSYRAKLSVDLKHDFIVMKVKCDALLQDVRRMEERLEQHVKELKDKGIFVS